MLLLAFSGKNHLYELPEMAPVPYELWLVQPMGDPEPEIRRREENEIRVNFWLPPCNVFLESCPLTVLMIPDNVTDYTTLDHSRFHSFICTLGW